jgi:sortase A
MKRTRAAVVVISSLLITAGLGTAGYAGVQIYQMNSSLGTQYLPKLEPSEPTQLPVEIVQPTVGDVIGSLWIPRLKRTIDIIEGTGAKELKIGVGHYVGSVLPGISDNSVLAGHRDSVFRNLGSLKLGDLMTIQTDYGRFVYEVHKIRIVKADDKTVIMPTSDSILTLSTCYPFRFIGNAPKRYIVQAGLVIGEPVG